MLTSTLVRARVKGATIAPTFIDVSRADLREPAERMLEAARAAEAEGFTQGELDEALKACIGTHRSHKVLRGFAKLITDRCEFEVDTPLPPAELRRKVFERAHALGPLALEEDDHLGRPTAATVLAEVGAELGVSGEAAARALYGDLRDAQICTRFRDLTVDELLHRYNVALVQALLLKATSVTVALAKPTVPRVRQLLRHAKFHQLLFRAHRDGDDLALKLDGPSSVFSQSTRYGLNLALFFPAVLLQDGPWAIEAEVLWTKAKHRKRLTLSSADGLVSHYRDTGAWEPRERQWFVERWEAQEGDVGWTMSEATTPIDLGGRGVILPDFTFTDGTRTAHLEIVGFWRRDWLERRLEGLRRHGPGNLILAVSKKLAAKKGEALAEVPGEVIPFAQIVPVKSVLDALEQVAKPEASP